MRGREAGRAGVAFFCGGVPGDGLGGTPPVGAMPPAMGRIAAALAKVRSSAASASRLRVTHVWKAPTVLCAMK